MNRHTPGPWRARLYGPSGYDIEGPDGEDLAYVNASDGADEPKFYPVKANARLIAAAPELLRAAHGALSVIPERGLSKPIRDALRVAIAKAEGEV